MWWDNQYWYFPAAQRPSGAAAHSVSPDSDEQEPDIKATLWLPDPGSRHGWGLKHVWSESPKKERRQLGFKKRSKV